MSLIVARVVGQNIFIVGDTALTYLHKVGANPLLEGCLKQYRVNDQLAIAFAGDALVFEGVCKKLLGCHDTTGVVEVALREIPKESDLDLLVCENGKENITFFKRGAVTVAPSGFIGDSVAYDRFQAAFHAGEPHSLSASANQGRFLRLPEPIDPNDTYVKLYSAMKIVIDDPKIPSVGGAIVPLCTDNGKFCFINHAETTLFLPSVIPDVWQRLNFGTAPMGGYSFDFGDDVPRGGSGNEVGFHLLQAGFGVIFPANADGFRRAELLEAATPSHWELNTSKRLGKGIASCFNTPNHCGRAGEQFLQAQNWGDALFCFELGNVAQLRIDAPAMVDRYIAGHAIALTNLDRAEDALRLLTTEIQSSEHRPDCQQVLSLVKQGHKILL